MTPKILDLKKEFPRSPREKLGNFFHLARMIDKVRAKAAGSLGEYIYPCPLDQSLLEFLNIQEEKFYDAVLNRDEGEILQWLQHNATPHPIEAIHQWNESFLNRKPKNQESMDHFIEIRYKVAPDRTDISTWIDLIDIEEGRPIPPVSH